MYKLQEYLHTITGKPYSELPDKFYCTAVNKERAMLTNRIEQTAAIYVFTLVRKGWLELTHNQKKLRLGHGDMYIYSPGISINIDDGSDDYQAISLMCDEKQMFETPVLHKIIHSETLPIAEPINPVINLDEEMTTVFGNRMDEIARYLREGHRFQTDIVNSLFSAFLLDMANIADKHKKYPPQGERNNELLKQLIHMMPKNFIEHRDLDFYASELCITTTHLSRIVRQTTGHTVKEYLDLLMFLEASWLLLNTDLSLSAIAEQLHFANQFSFSKFFTRMKGMSPKAYRMQR